MCIWYRRGRQVDGPIVGYKVFVKGRRDSKFVKGRRDSKFSSPVQGTPWHDLRLTAERQPQVVTENFRTSPKVTNDTSGIYAFATREGANHYNTGGMLVKRVRLTGIIIFHEGEAENFYGCHSGYRAEHAQILKWWQRS